MAGCPWFGWSRNEGHSRGRSGTEQDDGLVVVDHHRIAAGVRCAGGTAAGREIERVLMERADDHPGVDLAVGQRPAAVRADRTEGPYGAVLEPEDDDLLAVDGEGPALTRRDLIQRAER